MLERIKNIFRSRNAGIKQILDNENNIKSYLYKILPKEPVILEAGGYTGWDTIEMAKVWPNGIVYTFEPVPEIYKHLLSNTKYYTNVKAYPLALSDVNGIANMYVSSGNVKVSTASSSLLPPKEHLNSYPDIEFKQEIQIQTTTIESWANSNQVDHIDFMWLDMQGYELKALQHCGKILTTVKAIYLEVILKELYENAPLFDEVKSWMSQNGFVSKKEVFYSEDYGDVLFVREY